MKKGWEIKKIGDVCKVLNGGTPDTTIKEFWDGSNLWITPKDMGRLDSIYVDNTERKITDAGIKNSSAKILPPNSVVLSSRAPIGHLAINTKPISTNQGCKGLVPNAKITTLFLFYFLKKSVQLLNDLGSGTTFKELSGSKLEGVEIELPPLEEQQQIVSILDETFAAIDQAKENLQCNLQNAKDLFQSELNNIFTNKGEGWTEEKLGLATTKIGSGATPRGGNESYKEEGISLVRSMNVHDRYFKERNLAFIDNQQANELANVTLEENDVLLNITGASVARCCVMPKEYLPARVNQHVSILRPKKNILDAQFLNLLLTSRFYKDRLLETGAQGSTRQAITKAQLQDFTIHYPQLKEQQKIVRQLDALAEQTQQLEEKYQQKLNSLEELKKSILQKAFAGELTKDSAVTKPIPIPFKKIEGISATDLHVGLIALSLHKHQGTPKEKTFGHVKSEKIINLINFHLCIDLERVPIKDAAGPNDYVRVKKKVEPRAQKGGAFSVSKNEDGSYTYSKGNKFETFIRKATLYLGDDCKKVEQLIDLMAPLDTQQAEVVATVYSAWNNLILEGQEITDEAIVTEARENWHEAKLKIEREKFFKAIEWMKRKDLVPRGTGQVVAHK